MENNLKETIEEGLKKELDALVESRNIKEIQQKMAKAQEDGLPRVVAFYQEALDKIAEMDKGENVA